MSSIRTSKLFRRLRRTAFFHEILRPIWDRHLVKKWWAAKRPSPPPHAIKLAAMQYLADRIGARYLFETGAYLGDTVRALQGRFDILFSIELAESLARPLQAEFAHDPSIRIVIGDSGKMLPSLLHEAKGPAVFWLDAHYSGGPTVGDGFVPIFNEIKAISDGLNQPHAILVDDMIDFKGVDGYPKVSELQEFMEKLGYETFVANNMMHALKSPK